MIGAVPGAVGRLEHIRARSLTKHEIAPRLGDEAALAVLQALEENRQRAAHVARADHVGQAEGDVVEAGNLQIILGRGLGNRVAAVGRVFRMIEPDRLLQRLQAVAQRGLEIDEAPRLVSLRCLDQVAPPTQLVSVSLYQSSGSL